MTFSWNRCLICQKTTKEELRCPLRASGDKADPKLVYGSFIQNVSEFNALRGNDSKNQTNITISRPRSKNRLGSFFV